MKEVISILFVLFFFIVTLPTRILGIIGIILYSGILAGISDLKEFIEWMDLTKGA